MGSGCSRISDESRDTHVDVIPSPVLREQWFSTDVIIEILSRLPIKSLARCQVISKEWRALINGRYLTEIHLDRADVVGPWFNAPPEAPSVDHHPPPPPPAENQVDPVCYRHGCNGLILVTNLNSNNYHIWNPAIRRTLELPEPLHHDRSLGFAFAYVPTTRNFRIVSFYVDSKSSLCCQVITPGVDTAAWRELEVYHKT